ncbi:MAG: hypothetical protein JXX29_03480 [Deltaproteobacteria bacterium]|nr:hypothetical protein [Deltaproteobacteria bacterium]MBN2670704.1 hypothetical protein [Deltaproteobacteria bacterium]
MVKTQTLHKLVMIVLVGSVFTSYPNSNCRAQSIRELSQQHVEDSIEKEREDKKKAKEKAAQKKAEKKKTTPTPSSSNAADTQQKPKPKAAPKKEAQGETVAVFHHDPTEPVPKEKLPKRVIHKWLKIDPMGGIAYRGWIPQDYPTVETDIANYFTWMVAVKARFFDMVSLKKGYFESNGLSSPRHPYKQNAAKYGSYGTKAAFFLAELGIPILDAWEPVIRYETKAYQTVARTKGDAEVCIVDYNSSADDPCTESGTELTVMSAYETAVIGVTYYPSRNPSPVVEDRKGKKPPFTFGLGYLSYVKPYQITIEDLVLEELLFTGRFYGGGLAFGTKLGGGVNRPKLDIWTQFGLGAARLTKDMTLNELAPGNDWILGYIQGNLTFTFPWAPFKFAPTLLIVPSVEASGTMFRFIETKREAGEEYVMPLVNWDIVYCAQLSLVLTL